MNNANRHRFVEFDLLLQQPEVLRQGVRGRHLVLGRSLCTRAGREFSRSAVTMSTDATSGELLV